jgi:bacterioferritin (cytochrome b1)
MFGADFTTAYINSLQGTSNPKYMRFELLKEEFTNFTEKDTEAFKNKVEKLLLIALIDEQLAELNYLQSWSLSRTEGKTDYDVEFHQHEDDEREHKYKLIQRLCELDSTVCLAALDSWISLNSRGEKWTQEYRNDSGEILLQRLREEEEAVEFYTLCVNFLKDSQDSTTYTLFKEIKADEEEHVRDLRDLARDHGLMAFDGEHDEVSI